MRTEFQYNNQMYAMAGQLIATLANSTFAEMANNLIRSIGMNESTMARADDDHENLPLRSKPHYVAYGLSHVMNPDLSK